MTSRACNIIQLSLADELLTFNSCCAELHVQHCNDFFSVGNGAWSAISCVRSLRRLAVEDLHCRLDAECLKELAYMTQVSLSPPVLLLLVSKKQ